MKQKWNTTKPPKRTQKPVRLRYKDSRGKVYTGNFVWVEMENTFVECDIFEGPGLYEEDGWKILGWK
jgi:hypothetical protein